MKSLCSLKPSSSKSLLLTAAALITSLGSLPKTQAESPSPPPVEGILVLQNGNILRGKIQQTGELYQVHLSHGQLQVRAEQVEMFCENIDQAYQRRRAARGGSTADTHLELAGWCLRHNLLDYAAQELREAKTVDPEHPRLAFLQRHLQQTLKIAARKKQQQAQASIVTNQPPPNPETLEKAPKWARALFVRQIQPLIVQSCATTGCHQCGSDADFQLNRLALDGVGHPKVTLQNLAATLEQIDWQAADESTLLQRASQAHGALDGSIPLPPHKLKVLEGWIGQLAIAHRKQNELHKLPPVTELAALPQANQQPSGEVRQASYQPVDPFDPTSFNQRNATIEKPPAESPVKQTVPHVLTPSESTLSPAIAAEQSRY